MITPEQQAKWNAYKQQTGFTAAPVSPTNAANDIDKQIAEMKAKKPSPAQTVKSPYGAVGDTLGDFSEGVAKGLASTAKGLGSLGQTVLDQTAGRVVNAAEGKGFTPTGPDNSVSDLYRNGTDISNKAGSLLEAKGAAQSVGKFAEQTAEFAVPLSKVSTAVKGVELLSEASKIPKVLKVAVNTLPRAAAEALTSAGVVSAQSGEIDQDALTTGIIAGTIPFAGAVGSALKESLGSEFSARLINSLIKPLAKDFSYGKNPGRAVAEEGITASSFDELAQGIDNRLTVRVGELNALIDDAAAKGKKIDLTGVLKPIDDAIADAERAPNTNKAVIERLKGLKEDLMGVKTDEAGAILEQRNFGPQGPGEATDLKRLVGALTKFTGNASDDKTVNASLKKIYGNIKNKINEAVPEAAPLNERIADLISAKTATEYRDIISQRQNLVKIGDFGAGATAGLVTALATGGASIPTLIVGLGAAGLRHAMATPTVKTNLASWLARTAPAEREILFQKAPWAKGILMELLPQ